MATPIKQVPILTGEIAAAFVREAEENEKLPRYQISSEDEAWVSASRNNFKNSSSPGIKSDGVRVFLLM